jgi:hypothetical protein
VQLEEARRLGSSLVNASEENEDLDEKLLRPAPIAANAVIVNSLFIGPPHFWTTEIAVSVITDLNPACWNAYDPIGVNTKQK